MRIFKLVHKPTQVHITKLAKKNCILKYGEDYASLMLESVKNLETQKSGKAAKSTLLRFVDKIRPKKEFSINISSNAKSDFFVNSNLKIGNYNFVSQKQPFDFSKTLHTLKDFRGTVQKTRDDILEQLTDFNKLRRKFDRKIFRHNF